MSSTSSFGRSGALVVGALQQFMNELSQRVSIPIGPLPAVPVGDLLEPVGPAQRAGADAVAQWGGRHGIDPQAARTARPLLLATRVEGGGAGVATIVQIDADAPGADFGVSGRESGMVSLYVDGLYHSTIVVMAERTGGYAVNLGQLATGAHDLELRAATDVSPVQARVGAVSVRHATGEAALIDLHAPIIELRDTDRGSRHSTTNSDVPLVMVPALTRHPDGSRTIEYRVIFSNEDGGTATKSLYSKYGRGVDAEPLYRVTLDAHGRVTDERYQAVLHRWLDFDGARDPGGRPIVRISTSNNMVTARAHGDRVERWSEAAYGPVADTASEYETMLAAPWTWAVMGKELLREGKAASGDAERGSKQIGDPRSYVYLGPLTDAVRSAILAAGGLELELADGRRVLARIARGFAEGKFHQAALELPSGAAADAVRGVLLLGVKALVLDAAFRVRELA